MILNAPSSDEEQPMFEGAFRGVIAKLWNLAGDRDDSLLHDILRLGIAQTALPGDIVKEQPVRLKKGAPTIAIAQVAQPAQQTGSRRQAVVGGTQ